MRKDSPIQKKSYSFALDIVKLSSKLRYQSEFVLANQILKSGTSIGANVEEAIGAQSSKDFFMKITIAYKEARETRFWLRLLSDSGLVDCVVGSDLNAKIEELLKLLGTIQKTLKEKER